MGIPGKCRIKVFFQFILKEIVLLKGHLSGFRLHFLQNTVKLTLLFIRPVLFLLLFPLKLHILFLLCIELAPLFLQQPFPRPDPGSQIQFTAFQTHRIAFAQGLPLLLQGVSARVQL